MTIQTVRTTTDRLVLLVSSGGGLGFIPLTPGTFGSLPAIAIAYAWHVAGIDVGFRLATVALLFAIGVPLSTRTESILNKDDPGEVVIDEYVALAAIYATVDWVPHFLILGFVLFRVFDIWKPWPARRLDQFHGGLGIMLDDIAAAGYVLVVLQFWRDFQLPMLEI